MKFLFSLIALFIWLFLVLLILDFAFSLYSKIKYTITGRKFFQPKCFDKPLSSSVDMKEVKPDPASKKDFKKDKRKERKL